MPDIKEESIAHTITNGKLEIFDYDFPARYKRREGKQMDLNACRENLQLLKAIFDRYSITFFLTFGTCLGAVRDNNFLCHDTDTDIGVYMKDRANVLSIVPELKRVGFEPIRTSISDDFLSIMRKDEYIDIGFFQKKTDEHDKSYWGFNVYRVYGNHLDKLERISFLGDSYNIPQHVSRYLTMLYGFAWRIPMTGFHYVPDRSKTYFVCNKMKSKLIVTLQRLGIRPFYWIRYIRTFVQIKKKTKKSDRKIT